MNVYETAGLYITAAATLEERITRIDSVIDALLVVMVDSAGTAKFSEYTLNDGQTQIRAAYRDQQAITAQINALETLKNKYLNQLNGRVVRLVDSKDFRSC